MPGFPKPLTANGQPGASVSPQVRTCAVAGCNEPTWNERATYCLEHADPRHIRRSKRLDERRGGGGGGGAEAYAEVDTSVSAARALSAARLAAALQLTPSLEHAAAIAGISSEDHDLEQLETDARVGFADLIEGSAAAIQRIGFAGLSLQLLGAVAALDKVAPGQRATAAKSIIQTLEALQNAAKPSFGDMSIELVEDEGAPQ